MPKIAFSLTKQQGQYLAFASIPIEWVTRLRVLLRRLIQSGLLISLALIPDFNPFLGLAT